MVLMIWETHLPDHLFVPSCCISVPQNSKVRDMLKQLNIRSMKEWTSHRWLESIDIIKEEGALNSGKNL